MTRVRPDLPYPLRLEPRFLPKPWGGRRLATVLGRELPGTGPIGECWEVFDRDGGSSRIVNGPLAGRHLAEVRGDEPFPLLFKLLDATGPLSVQVHPGSDAARRFHGEPKAESWFVLHADPGARVYRGLREGVGEDDLRRAIAERDVARCLHAFEVQAGDVVFLPPGTVHSIAGGVLLAEIQENSDTTYRLYDWPQNRGTGEPRALHVDEALGSIDFGARGEDRVRVQVVEDGAVTRLLLVQCRWFTAEHVAAMGTFTLEVEPSPVCSYAVLHVLAGTGTITPFHRHVEPQPFRPGDTFLLPAEFDDYEVEPGASVVRALLFRR